MNRRGTAVTLLALIAAVVIPASVVHAGDRSTAADPVTRAQLQQLVGVNFVSTCAFSHRAGDDPIV